MRNTRRSLLRAAGMTGAFALTGAWTIPPAPSRFDLAAPGRPLFLRKPLHNKTVMQSLAFDNVNGHVYIVQLMAGGQQLPGEAAPVSGASRDRAGDLCLTKLDLDGNELGHMFLKGFGHGVQIGAEPVGSSAFLWTEVDSFPDDGASGWGTRLARFRFDDGAILTPEHEEVRRIQPIPGADRTTCGIDPAAGQLVMRHRIGGSFRYALYSLEAMRTNKFTPIASVAQPALTYSFQGYASYGGYLYLLEGSSYGSATSQPPIGNTHLTCLDWATGAVVDRRLVLDGAELPFREPEGMAIQIPDASTVRLAFGFATTTSPTDTSKLANVYFKDVMI
jgi:Phage 5-bladed beta propeller receptor binding platform domain